MKIKLDENMPAALAQRLAKLGHEVNTVLEEGIGGSSDEVVWETVQDEGRFPITQDLDLSDLRRYAPGTHNGVMLVRLRRPGRLALRDRVEAAFRSEDASRWPRCFVVLTENKLRVRRPRGSQGSGEGSGSGLES
jgi:predicted nuclease of predicted toxin-antitoxin system